jgi:hypothetical protein
VGCRKSKTGPFLNVRPLDVGGVQVSTSVAPAISKKPSERRQQATEKPAYGQLAVVAGGSGAKVASRLDI